MDSPRTAMESINSIANIQSILGDKFMERFKVFHEQTLFPIDWSVLRLKKCPLCFNKLKFPPTRPIVYCNSKKHGKNFVISLEKFNKVK